MALRVTSREGEALATPTYQAATMVRNRQKASTARAMPATVKEALSGCLRVLRQVSFNIRGQGPGVSFWQPGLLPWAVFQKRGAQLGIFLSPFLCQANKDKKDAAYAKR